MFEFKRPRHRLIQAALGRFDSGFLTQNRIYFGGGTRISMELDEYRESVHIDFLCPDKAAYRAVRESVTNVSLGRLVVEEFDYLRDIRFDRYGVRTFLDWQGERIKLEIISCDDYLIEGAELAGIPVPVVDHTACFTTKLLANADRSLSPPYKDILDLLMMQVSWGDIPEQAWFAARQQYGRAVDQFYEVTLNAAVSQWAKLEKEALPMGISPEKLTLLRTKATAELQRLGSSGRA